jgi:hypothetical protein
VGSSCGFERVPRFLRSATMAGLGSWAACGSAPVGDGAAVEVVVGRAPPGDAEAVDGQWRFADGATVREVAVAPAVLEPGAPVTVAFDAVDVSAGCGARVGLLAPSSASRQEVWRGRPLSYPVDPRDVWVGVDALGGAATVELPLPAPWHPSAAVVALELDCGDGPLRVVEGARAEVLRDGEPVADARAILNVAEVRRRPTRVAAPRGGAPFEIDGTLAEPVWQRPGTLLTDSLDGEPSRGLTSEVWLAWDAQALVVAARLEDEDLWSDYRDQDDPLWRQDAFEIFVAADDSGERYVELQVSSRGVTFDAHFSRHRRGDEAWDGPWRAAVQVDGTVDDATDRDRGWSVEAAIPWTMLCEKTRIACTPTEGSTMRVNLFRLERPDRERQRGQSLSPTLVPDFHAWNNAAELVLAP